MWFLTIDSIHKKYPFFIAKFFRATVTAGVFFEDFSLSRIYPILWHTPLPLSCVCTSPLAFMTIVGLPRSRQGIHFSITQVLFADHMHWRTRVDKQNSRSSGLRFGAGRPPIFPKVRRMFALSRSFKLNTLLASFPRCFAGTLALATLSLPETDPQILERWGFADEVSPGQNISERRILVSNFSVTCNSLREFYTLDWFLHVWALPENRLRRLHVLRDTTQLSCVRWLTSSRSSFQLMITILIRSSRSVVTFTMVDNRLPYIFVPIILLLHSYCTLVFLHSFWTFFTRLFINLTVCTRALFPKTGKPLLVLYEQAFGRVPLVTDWVVASSFKVILAKPSRHSTTGTSILWDFGFSMLFSHSAAWKNSEMYSTVSFFHAYWYRGGNYNCLL